jgi:hypothetical protein
MSTQYLMVLTDPIAGQEDAFNDWYDNRHLDDVLKVDGFVSAQRFRLSQQKPPTGTPSSGYLAIYEMETDDAEATVAGLLAQLGTDTMPVSPAVDTSRLNLFVATALAPAKRRG